MDRGSATSCYTSLSENGCLSCDSWYAIQTGFNALALLLCLLMCGADKFICWVLVLTTEVSSELERHERASINLSMWLSLLLLQQMILLTDRHPNFSQVGCSGLSRKSYIIALKGVTAQRTVMNLVRVRYMIREGMRCPNCEMRRFTSCYQLFYPPSRLNL